MARKQKQASPKDSNGLPIAPWILVTNTFSFSDCYAAALCSLIPDSAVKDCVQPLLPISGNSEPTAVSIWANFPTTANNAASVAREHQVAALKRGCNMVSVALCNDITFGDLQAVAKEEWPIHHITVNVEGMPTEAVAERILRWLFTVLTVRETLYLIPESEMLAVDKSNYPDHDYCALKDAHKHRKDCKLQFIALIASQPEVSESNKLTWKVVDRSGDATFYFHYRGPGSQHTWDWVLSLRVGDRKVLPRMPMIPMHEPLAKKIILSPLRATGATIRGVGHVAVGIGRGVHWVGEKVSVRRPEADKYVSEVEWKENLQRKTEEALRERQRKINKGRLTEKGGNLPHEASIEDDNRKERPDFKIFNEKGEKTWSVSEDDQASTIAPSWMDEKIAKELY